MKRKRDEEEKKLYEMLGYFGGSGCGGNGPAKLQGFAPSHPNR
jgi:hypothetical protein